MPFMTNAPARSLFACLIGLVMLGGCATLPPGADYPKTVSLAFEEPRTTTQVL